MQAAAWLKTLLLLASLGVPPPVAAADQAPSVTADTIRNATPPNNFETYALPVVGDEDAPGSKSP